MKWAGLEMPKCVAIHERVKLVVGVKFTQINRKSNKFLILKIFSSPLQCFNVLFNMVCGVYHSRHPVLQEIASIIITCM